jgi:diaminohydroxyphosphoribosylaminopyrimidine deaminase/5-amino-6-(5-phosphoribosylamino)uracil reductase
MEKKYVQIDFETSLAKQILSYLYQNEIQSIIIEGGAKTLNLFIEENLWDEARVFETQKAIDNGIRVNQLLIPFANETLIGEDTLKTYHNS